MFKRMLLSLGLIAVAHAIAHNTDPQFSQIIEQDKKSVVSIMVDKVDTTPFEEPPQQDKPKEAVGLGSGIVVDSKHGLIITNAHVVNNAKLIVVRLNDDRRYVGHLIGEDTGFDIAVLKINTDNLNAIPFADSDKLRVGSNVVAIGSPFGLTKQ